MEGNVSQIVDMGPGLILYQKAGRFFHLPFLYFSMFRDMKSKAYKKEARHGSLDMNILNSYVKF